MAPTEAGGLNGFGHAEQQREDRGWLGTTILTGLRHLLVVSARVQR
jgi:hypothetical protein